MSINTIRGDNVKYLQQSLIICELHARDIQSLLAENKPVKAYQKQTELHKEILRCLDLAGTPHATSL